MDKVEVPTRVIWRKDYHYWDLIIDKCPFCGETHHHGGGDEAKPNMGYRESHCSGDKPAEGWQYYLVLKNE